MVIYLAKTTNNKKKKNNNNNKKKKIYIYIYKMLDWKKAGRKNKTKIEKIRTLLEILPFVTNILKKNNPRRCLERELQLETSIRTSFVNTPMIFSLHCSLGYFVFLLLIFFT